MARFNKEETAKEEADILAAEHALQQRWCVIKGHRWDLPQPNPINSTDPDLLRCPLRCNRCGATAVLTITLDVAPAAPSPTPNPTSSQAPKKVDK